MLAHTRRHGSPWRGAVVLALACMPACLLASCQDSRTDAAANAPSAGDSAHAVTERASASALSPADSAVLRLSSTASAYRTVPESALLGGGAIVGHVELSSAIAGDSAIVPTVDVAVCKPFTDTRTPSQGRGVGNAIVWLDGVASGPINDAPRRASLRLDRCRLEPRVQRMALGGTLQVASRDAMTSRLRFVDAARVASVRARVMLTDAGQLVPTADVAAVPGLVEVRDDEHPWVRAYVAVAAHPFVAITTPNGQFQFDRVPPGTYTLVTWQEQLGVRIARVLVTRGATTTITTRY
jgi:hypothetical protein